MFSNKRKIYAVNVVLETMTVFNSKEDAVSACPGIEIAEGDWIFFDHSGRTLKAYFTIPAQLDEESNTFSNGVYHLAYKEDVDANK